MAADKQAQIRQAQAQIASLEAQKRSLTARIRVAAATEKRRIEALIANINHRISGAKGILQRLVSAVDLVRQIPGGQQAINKVGARVGSAIDKFLEKGKVSREIVRTPRIGFTFPTPIAIITLNASAQMTLKGEFDSKRSGTTITSEGKLTGTLTGNLSASAGFKIKGYGPKATIGITVNASARGASKMILAANGANLSASLNPADITVSASADIYFELASLGGPGDFILRKAIDMGLKATGASSSIIRKDNKLTYRLGSGDLFILTTPIYKLNFSIGEGRFSLMNSGEYKCRIHPTLKSKFDYLKKSFGSWL